MKHEPIAIIGMGCRFPGGANSPDAFWQLLRNGVDAITEVPAGRFDVDAFYDSTPATPGKIVTREGGFLDQIDQFDAAFFGISAREAIYMDPQQRLLLEVAWEALEDAGQPPDRMAGSQTGVFVGMWINDYEARMLHDPDRIDFYMTTGSGRYSASGRLSYVLGLQGPSISVDTACSSSLVAVHLAVQSLRSGECDMALAGAANTILQPYITIAYSQSQMMAPDGRCKFGDARANGYVRSEGAAVLVLKRLSQALADGDPIYALIRGSAVNNDGRTSGFMTTPGQEGQEDMLRKAYHDAGVLPGEVDYVEAHGTGTNAGDPVEIGALGAVLGEGRPEGSRCGIGSVKTNIGHTEGAAGMAGLIKVALSLKHRWIPRSLHFEEPNPNIRWEELPVFIQSNASPWPVDTRPRIGGISSFGIAGTNAHVVLEEALVRPDVSDSECRNAEIYVLPLSAHSPQALVEMAQAYQQRLLHDVMDLYDLCYTAAVRRMHHNYRLAVVGPSPAEIAEQLSMIVDGKFRSVEPVDAPRRVVFVFPGQGGQWLGMGRQLYEREPVFREALERCQEAMKPYVDWLLLDELMADGAVSRLEEIDVVQPALFAIQVALSALWRSWGVEPDAVIGHSMGEAAAAHVAGILSLEDAAHIICRRSQLMKRVSGRGAMAVVELTLEEAQKALNGYEDRLSIAVSNGPRSTVISGDPAALQAVVTQLQSQDIFCRMVKVDVAAHSSHMDALQPELVRDLNGLQPQPASVPIYSTVTGALHDGQSFNAGYWGWNLRQPVLFSGAVQQALADGCDTFIEINPHPILLPVIERSLPVAGLERIAVVPSTRREEDEQRSMLESLGALYTQGYPVDWQRLYPNGGRCVPLPSYPWQRERFWFEAEPAKTGARIGQVENHPLLGLRLPDLAHLPGHYVWETKPDSRFRAYLRKHWDWQAGALPDAMYHEMALAGIRSAFGDRLHRITHVEVDEPLFLSESPEARVQLTITSENEDTVSFQIFSRDQEVWQRHAAGRAAISQVETSWLYELRWEPAPRQALRPIAPSQPGSWLIFADSRGVGDSLAGLLEHAGERCILVRPGDSFVAVDEAHFTINPESPEDAQQLIAALRADDSGCRGVVHLWSLDAPMPSELTASTLEAAQVVSCGSVLHILQALAQADWSERPRLWLVTQGAQAVHETEQPALVQSPLWGFGRVVAKEHPELWGALIDLDSNTTSETLLEEIRTPDGEDQVAYRQGERFALRLVRASERHPAPTFQWRDDSAYLITGGLGGIGLHVARWMVEQGARHLVLMGRTRIPPRESWGREDASSDMGQKIAVIRELEAMGATVHLASVDVADEDGLRAYLKSYQAQGLPPIRGVIHAAGVIEDRLLLQMDISALQFVTRAKVTGAWLLHHLLDELDTFVMFSSMGSLMGPPGQGNYAAANAFLDTLGYFRRSQGKRAVTINWGVWDNLGFAATVGGQHLTQQLRQEGIGSLTTQQGLEALGWLLAQDGAQIMVMPADWTEYRNKHASRRFPLLTHLVEESEEAIYALEPDVPSASTRERLLAVELDQRTTVLGTHIQEQVARVLKMPPAAIAWDKPLGTLGMDSLMGLELRNRLEASLGLTLPATLVWNYPTIETMIPYLANKMEIPLVENVTSARPPNGQNSEELGRLNEMVADIQSLSDDDILKTLMGKR